MMSFLTSFFDPLFSLPQWEVTGILLLIGFPLLTSDRRRNRSSFVEGWKPAIGERVLFPSKLCDPPIVCGPYVADRGWS